MTDFNSLNPGQQDIVRAQNAAVQKLPDDLNARLSIWNDDEKRRQAVNDKIAQVKKDMGLSEMERLLTERYGYSPQAIRWIRQLRKMPPLEAAGAASLFIAYAKDATLHYPTFFDVEGFGVGSGDEPGETAGFDKTSEGQRRGGEKAQPRTTEDMAASHEPKGTGPGLSHDEIVARFEAANKAYLEKGGRGKKPNEWHEAKKALDESNAARDAAEEAAPEPAAPEPAKPDNVVSFTEQQRRANAKGEEHIKQQSEKKAAERAGKATTAREEKKPTGRGKKAEAAPEANPALADDEDEEAPAAAPPPGQIGTAPATFRMG